jgi:hypothetical protein
MDILSGTTVRLIKVEIKMEDYKISTGHLLRVVLKKKTLLERKILLRRG